MKIKIKKLVENAVIPAYSKQGDAGLDLTAVSRQEDEYGNLVYGTGLSFEIPTGFVGMLFPRSSNSKTDLSLTNSVGVLDSGYRGEVMFKFGAYRFNSSKEIEMGFGMAKIVQSSVEFQIGDRIGQLIIIPYPTIEFEEVTELSTTERGINGYGSTGK